MKKQLVLLCIAAMITLSGCGKHVSSVSSSNNNDSGGHAGMNHSTSSEIPKGLQVAHNPTFKIGSQALVNADHMEGMKGATATIVGAYTTTAYKVSYTPTTGGHKVTNHKWVIHEEIKDAGDKLFEPGAEVVLQAEHMKGMKGATAVINSSEQTTVYILDYIPASGGEIMTNHKWVTESELTSK